MNENKTELVFILDRSGSMSGLEDDTIGGFNGMLNKQKDAEADVSVTTVLFDDKVDIIHDRFPISIVGPLTDKDYYVRGCTALLDAIGVTLQKIENVQNHLPEDYKAGNVIFVITTDGHENSSKEYTYSEIKRMVEEKKEDGWEFLFLGANIDAVGEAQKLGISRNRSVTYENDSKGVELNYVTIGTVLKNVTMRKPGSSRMSKPVIPDDWGKNIEDYLQSKKAGDKR